MKERRFRFALEDSKAVAKRSEEIEELCREFVRSSVPPKP